MNLEILQKALRSYVVHEDCTVDEKYEALQALESCAKTSERFTEKDIWKSDVYVVPAPAIVDMLNILTYNIFGKRAKLHGPDFPLSYYTHDCRAFGGDQISDQLADEVYELGYDVVRDPWIDNEHAGIHNADGTFDYDNVEKLGLKDAQKFLDIITDFTYDQLERHTEIPADLVDWEYSIRFHNTSIVIPLNADSYECLETMLRNIKNMEDELK